MYFVNVFNYFYKINFVNVFNYLYTFSTVFNYFPTFCKCKFVKAKFACAWYSYQEVGDYVTKRQHFLLF